MFMVNDLLQTIDPNDASVLIYGGLSPPVTRRRKVNTSIVSCQLLVTPRADTRRNFDTHTLKTRY
ncbi:hypothetical protein E2C01_042286 [Portunus trituberculatus]|uniref:Uncharacterized protein n=1 Tax=Portunus trituberculatus TaxID=210409 RepID=A0A5B7FPT4_PORTR|nr:hypothetical protein [Portunus trituberculatus]